MVEFPLRRLTSPTTAAFVAARSRVWYIRLRLGWGGPVGGVDLFIIRRNPGWLGRVGMESLFHRFSGNRGEVAGGGQSASSPAMH